MIIRTMELVGTPPGIICAITIGSIIIEAMSGMRELEDMFKPEDIPSVVNISQSVNGIALVVLLLRV
ncbi:hypothetical protein B0A49_12916 [Cryomyces minteri]|uniref:Uncharacterized protein n=1 Tax=Cryomyces minteri TaxID=331657 RepID=A0A4U0UK69_9PEZI|nr:hypothetical protein B0A49_12916 [Cryomyces minteri]